MIDKAEAVTRSHGELVYSRVPEPWGELKDSKDCKHEQGWVSKHEAGSIWHCSDCGMKRYQAYE